jgi:hypothetical protein
MVDVCTVNLCVWWKSGRYLLWKWLGTASDPKMPWREQMVSLKHLWSQQYGRQTCFCMSFLVGNFSRHCKYRDPLVSMMGLLIGAKQLLGWDVARETEVLWENLPLCPQIPYDLGPHSGHHGGKPLTNRLSNGTVKILFYMLTWSNTGVRICEVYKPRDILTAHKRLPLLEN